MNKELKRISIVVLAMFLALFTSSSIIQVFQADALAEDDRNTRTLFDSYSAERGPILVDGQPVAQSVPVDDEYRFQRQYPGGALYAPVTGYFTLNQGTTGIENELNDFLSGTANEQFLDQLNAIITGQTPKGSAVELTIDPVVQQAAWDALGDLQGAVVAIDPSTGAILAMVSKPSFDPNALAVRDTEQVIAAYDALIADPADPLQNRAIGGDLNPPGSVFKVLMTAALIDSGQFTPQSLVPNPPTFELPGTTTSITNSEGGACGGTPEVDLATAFRLSCNIPFAEFGLQLGGESIQEYAERFGFGDELEIPMTATPSQYPLPEDDAQLALSSFGQANDRMTPLQAAMLSAAIANGGTLMQPYLVESIIDEDLSETRTEPSVYNMPISEATASTVTQLMIQNVANGAGSNARIEGVDVAGKTGTAENGQDDPYTLWFTGFAPAAEPRVAVAVVVENGGGRGQSAFGNQVAAPVAKSVIEAVLSR